MDGLIERLSFSTRVSVCKHSLMAFLTKEKCTPSHGWNSSITAVSVSASINDECEVAHRWKAHIAREISLPLTCLRFRSSPSLTAAPINRLELLSCFTMSLKTLILSQRSQISLCYDTHTHMERHTETISFQRSQGEMNEKLELDRERGQTPNWMRNNRMHITSLISQYFCRL